MKRNLNLFNLLSRRAQSTADVDGKRGEGRGVEGGWKVVWTGASESPSNDVNHERAHVSTYKGVCERERDRWVVVLQVRERGREGGTG